MLFEVTSASAADLPTDRLWAYAPSAEARWAMIDAGLRYRVHAVSWTLKGLSSNLGSLHVLIRGSGAERVFFPVKLGRIVDASPDDDWVRFDDGDGWLWGPPEFCADRASFDRLVVGDKNSQRAFERRASSAWDSPSSP